MKASAARLGGLVKDAEAALLFCTRLPLGSSTDINPSDVARAAWAMPFAGALVGAIGSLAYLLAFQIGLAPASSAMLALAATLMITGALHEDGLADTFDGFGGGASADRKLAIMRDSRIGTFGVCALVVSLLLRWSAIASIAEPSHVAMALVAAHASSRAPLFAVMRYVPAARSDGLSAAAGRPSLGSIAAAAVIAAISLLLTLDLEAAMVSILLLVFSATFMGWFTLQQIRGQTGDVLGALEQMGEILVLLTAAAMARA